MGYLCYTLDILSIHSERQLLLELISFVTRDTNVNSVRCCRGLTVSFGTGQTVQQCMIVHGQTLWPSQWLEDALAHPENYRHLLVRCGGYSAVFVELPPDVQQEIINRNAY